MNEDMRSFVHGLWGAVATSWIERADFLDVRGADVTKAILDRASIRSSDRVLALADGPGGLALAVAPYAATVVSSDVVPELVEAAKTRAQARGARNLTARVVDIEDIDATDESFNVVVCREGLMFAVDPERAFAEIARVLQPGGRVAAAVWGAPVDNPWLSIVIDSVSEIVGHPVPPVGMPGPFALSDETQLRALSGGAGFVAVEVDAVEVPFHAESLEQWWGHTTALAGPVARIVAGFDDAANEKLRALLASGLAPFATIDGFELPGRSLVLSATKP